MSGSIDTYILHHITCTARAEATEILSALDHECMHVENINTI